MNLAMKDKVFLHMTIIYVRNNRKFISLAWRDFSFLEILSRLIQDPHLFQLCYRASLCYKALEYFKELHAIRISGLFHARDSFGNFVELDSFANHCCKN